MSPCHLDYVRDGGAYFLLEAYMYDSKQQACCLALLVDLDLATVR